MIILGLDPGLARTGFGLLDTAKPQLFVRCGCLTTPASQAAPDRLVQLGQDLNIIIKESKPDQAVIEDIFFGTNTTTAILTAQARGVLLYVLRQHHITVNALTPLQIKSRLTGFGKADKHQMQSVITQRLQLSNPPQPDDAADALAAALCLVDSRPEINNISAYNKKNS